MTYTDPTAVAAIADAIEAEQNYVFAAGLAGAYLKGAGRRRAVNQLAEHRAKVQAASLMINPSAVPQTPPGFEPPTPITDAKSARESLADLNNTLVGFYANIAAVTEGDDRRWAIASAQASARDAVQWGAASQAFPT